MDTFFLADNNELEIKTNIELCEKMIKLFIHDYYKTYYPRRWNDICNLLTIPKKVLMPSSIAYIPDTNAELAIIKGGLKYSIKLTIGSRKTEITENLKAFKNNTNLSDQENLELLNEINELRVTLSNMAVWAFDTISVGWELPIDITLKLHEDGAIHFESNNDSSVAIRCRKSSKFLYAKLVISEGSIN